MHEISYVNLVMLLATVPDHSLKDKDEDDQETTREATDDEMLNWFKSE